MGVLAQLSWQGALTAQKVSSVLGCIQSPVGSRAREGAHSGETHPECCIQHWGAHLQKDMDLLE